MGFLYTVSLISHIGSQSLVCNNSHGTGFKNQTIIDYTDIQKVRFDREVGI